MKILVLIFYSLFFVSIICIDDKRDEDLVSDVASGMLKGIYHAGDAIVTVAKAVKEVSKIIGKVGDSALNTAKKIGSVLNAKNDAIMNIVKTERIFQKASLMGYSDIVEKSTKIVEKNPYHYIFRIKPITETKFFEKTLGEAGQFIVGTTSQAIKALPYISSVYNGFEARKRFMNGEIVGGTLKLAESAVSLIPGISFIPSILPSVGSLIYDLAK